MPWESLEITMLFEGLNRHRLKGSGAGFRSWKHHDVNPLSGRTKERVLHAPNEKMLKLQRRFLKNLRRLKVSLPAATAVAGGSPLANARRHTGNRFFFLTDISDAFGSVDGEKLAQVLHELDKESSIDEIRDFLKSYCLTQAGGLIAGSPSSQDLFNLYCGALLDKPLLEYCATWDIRYSRYMDDLTFSSNLVVGAKKREKLREIIGRVGFRVSHHKSQVFDLSVAPIEINGVGVAEGGRFYLPRRYVKKIRGLIRVIHQSRDERLMQKLTGMMGLYFANTVLGQRKSAIDRKLLLEYYQLRDEMRRLKRGIPLRTSGALTPSIKDPALDDDLDDLPF